MVTAYFLWKIQVSILYYYFTCFFFLSAIPNRVTAPPLSIAIVSHNARLFVPPVFGMFTFVTLLLVATIPYWLK